MNVDKELTDMTLEELWELFPIVLVPHNPQWHDWAVSEIAFLKKLLSGYSPAVSHIGSTAVPSICAKPIIDILIEISREDDWRRLRNTLEENGYICMSCSSGRMSFNKGYTPQGYDRKVFHVHVHAFGDNNEIYFRDYLNAHVDVAKEYESLKLRLSKRYKNDRDAYTEAKAEFVNKISELARIDGELRIDEIVYDKRRFLPLLLIGDECEAMIDRYLERGRLFVGFLDSSAVSVCVVTVESEDIVEVKNLAVNPRYQRRGIGRRMLGNVEKLYAGKTIIIGTGETPSTLRFYQSCGYRYSHRIAGFFTDNYPGPIIEDGVRLKDMLYLSKQLRETSES